MIIKKYHVDYTNLSTVEKSGQIGFLRGLSRYDNPVSERTNANARLMWDRGWVKQEKIKCRGIEIFPNVFSGCTQTDGDCPVCGQ